MYGAYGGWKEAVAPATVMGKEGKSGCDCGSILVVPSIRLRERGSVEACGMTRNWKSPKKKRGKLCRLRFRQVVKEDRRHEEIGTYPKKKRKGVIEWGHKF